MPDLDTLKTRVDGTSGWRADEPDLLMLDIWDALLLSKESPQYRDQYRDLVMASGYIDAALALVERCGFVMIQMYWTHQDQIYAMVARERAPLAPRWKGEAFDAGKEALAILSALLAALIAEAEASQKLQAEMDTGGWVDLRSGKTHDTTAE